MIKKLTALLLSLVFAISLIGCGANVMAINGESKVVRLYIGQEGVFENANYTYESDNTDVLEVNGSSYKALKAGSASVKVSDGNLKVAVYLFVVFGNKPVELTGLTINGVPSGNSVEVGQVLNLSYLKQPANADAYDAILWECSDSELLSIDKQGNVTANKMGSATVTLKALGTNVSTSVTINVLPRETIFALNMQKLVGVEGKTEQLLVANVLCDYPMQKQVSWFTQDENVVTVNNGELTFVAEGKTKVGINAVIDNVEYNAYCDVTVLKDEGFTVIRTPEQLQQIGNVSANYMLGNDIDMAVACAEGGELYNAGKGFMPLFETQNDAFKGVFEGNGFAIKNIMINRINDSFVAFMRYISAEEGSEGVIRNLSIIGGSIKGGNYTSVFYANSFGYGSVNSGLKNCYVELDMYSVGTLSCLVGNNKGIVENCVSKVTVDALGKVYLFALNHTIASDLFGVKNCVYIGESNAEFANVSNGGFVSDCNKITLDQVATFNFNLGDGWNYVNGEIPTVKGV